MDEDSKMLSKIPLHDEYSHAADAFRYFAVNAKEKRRKGGEGLIVKEARARLARIRQNVVGASGWQG